MRQRLLPEDCLGDLGLEVESVVEVECDPLQVLEPSHAQDVAEAALEFVQRSDGICDQRFAAAGQAENDTAAPANP